MRTIPKFSPVPDDDAQMSVKRWIIITPHACARGKVICLSIVVVVIVVHRKLGYFEIYKSKQDVNGTKLSKSAKT